MNKQEILDEIATLKERLNNLEKQYDFFNSPYKRWRAERGGGYYLISAVGSIRYDNENEAIVDGLHYDIGNYFKTEKEAEFEVERLKVIAELKEYATPVNEFDWNNSLEKKYTILLESDEVRVDYFISCQTSDLYFKTKEQAKNAIESVGEDRIIKYYFRRGETNGNSN